MNDDGTFTLKERPEPEIDAAPPPAPARRRRPVEASAWQDSAYPALLVTVLLAALLPWRIGGGVSPTGELQGGVPASAIWAVVAVLIAWRLHGGIVIPRLRWPLALFLATLAAGFLGLDRADWRDAAKELVQIAVTWGAGWYLFAIADRRHWRGLPGGIAFAAVVLLVVGLLRIGLGWHPLGLSDAKFSVFLVLAIPFVLAALRTQRFWVTQVVLWLTVPVVGWGFGNGGLIVAFLVAAFWTARRLERRLVHYLLPPAAVLLALSFWAPQQPWTVFRSRYDADHPRRLVIEYRAALAAPKEYPAGGGLGQYKRTINVLRQAVPELPSPTENKIPADSNSQYFLTLVEAGLPAAAMLLIVFLAAFGRSWRRLPEVRDEADEIHPAINGAALGLLLAAGFATVLSQGVGLWAAAVVGLAGTVPKPRSQPSSGGFVFRLAIPVLAILGALAVMAAYNKDVDRLAHVSRANADIAAYLYGDYTAQFGPDVQLTDSRLPIIRLREDEAVAPTVVIHVEGESYQYATGHFLRIQANDAEGNRALEIPPGEGKQHGYAEYRFTVPEAGSYRLVARVFWTDGCSNSLGFRHGDDQHTVASELFNTWHELGSPRLLDLPAGENSLQVRNVEDGVRLDWFELQLAKPTVP